MRHSFNLVLSALLLAVPVSCAQAANGLSMERAGIGLKRPPAPAESAALRPWRSDFALAATAPDSSATAYGGLRDRTRLGLASPESFGGISYAISERIAGYLELGIMEGSAVAPRRYSLSGQLQTAFDSGSGMSLGLTWRVYEPDYGARLGADMGPANGYSLVPVRTPGTGLGPSYQLQLHYQYNPTTTFGLVLGRELETFTAVFDSPGGPRQYSFTGQHWLTPSWALSYDVLSNDPSSFRLQGLRLGVRYRF